MSRHEEEDLDLKPAAANTEDAKTAAVADEDLKPAAAATENQTQAVVADDKEGDQGVVDLKQPGLDEDVGFDNDKEEPKAPAEEFKLKDPPPSQPPVDEEMGAIKENDQQAEGEEQAPDGGKDDTFEDEEAGAKKEDGDKPKKPKREINPNFKDVKETGKWGTISKFEMIVVGIALVLLIIGVIVAVVYVTVLKDDDDETETVLIESATSPPTPAPTPIPPELKFANITAAIGSNNATINLMDELPDELGYYIDKGAAEDGSCDMPHFCAMHWSMYEDEFSPAEDNMVARFALAAIYYSMGGNAWLNNSNWLTSDTSYCDWYGIKCDRVGTNIEELDLAENNVKGTIAEELALLQSIEVISFKSNEVSGVLPGDIFASLPELFVLYVQSNALSGTIPSNLRDNEALSLLFLHDNDFTGDYPMEYCGSDGVSPVFREFSVDCDENSCPEGCCESLNCY